MVAINRFPEDSASADVRLEYVKRRKILRLWPSEAASEPIEIHRAAVLEALGDDPKPGGPPPRFLLIAGVPGRPGGGGDLQPLVAGFEHEDQARAAFRSLRLRAHPKTAWAQVVSLHGERPRPVCWFGSSPVADSLAEPVIAPADARISEVKPAVRRWRTWPRKTS